MVRVTEVVGTSAESWEAAGRAAVADVARTVAGLQSAEVVKQDLVIEDGVVVAYRVRLAVAFDPGGGGSSRRRSTTVVDERRASGV
ncbi:dodecin family protein [Pseudonocardia humida]|nr:dodecin family protein [Pseudonocardia humida]